MQLTQQQFVADCLAKYRWEPIPSDQKWEEAHFPLPKCLGGEETVMLWSADHVVQGLLQSVEHDYRCFHGYRTEFDTFNLTEYYPEYLELFEQLMSKFNSWSGKKGGEITGAQHTKNKTGVCGRSAEQMTVDGKKGAAINKANGTGAFFNPELQSVNGKKGGEIGGIRTVELGVGIHGLSAEQMTANSKIAAKIMNAQRWQCLVTGHISNPGGLATYQKKRGIDTKLRVKLN